MDKKWGCREIDSSKAGSNRIIILFSLLFYFIMPEFFCKYLTADVNYSATSYQSI